jgi:sugar lactone lactonase YvrE
VLRKLLRAVVILCVFLALLALAVRAMFGGGDRLADRTKDPTLPATALEKVVDLDYPPGNIAVSASGRVFFTLHPDGHPPVKLAELVDGKPSPYPDAAFQVAERGKPNLQSPLALRIDRQNRLWVLDYADYARGQPRLLAFDLATNQLVHQYDFPSAVAPFLSMLNDFQVDPAGRSVYIADASPILQRPALVLYDTVTRTSRRVLDGDPSVQAEPYVVQAPGRDMVILGLYALRIPVDSIALDVTGEWLYYGPLSGDRMYRLRTRDLDDASLDARALGAKVQDYGPKTISDGLSTDVDGDVYVSDPEHSAVLILTPERQLETLVKDARLRWPDGFSFGPDGWLYVTSSALQDVLFVSADHLRRHAPYQIFRFKPGHDGIPGR